ncbi:hypothetical protein [Streptomyces sp. NPDC000410]|uniref:hypothetical protein n=1 Tax=Streptomyces sp. NPDC000410 TaxID=3154254 RepID=UPI00331D8F45
MHTYDPTRQPSPSQSHIPSLRHSYAHDASAGHSATPIYDALYSEYRRSFRALPGDRSGEEHLGFTAFGSGPHTGRAGHAGHLSAWQAGVRQHTGVYHVPAALPPSPRRGL